MQFQSGSYPGTANPLKSVDCFVNAFGLWCIAVALYSLTSPLTSLVKFWDASGAGPRSIGNCGALQGVRVNTTDETAAGSRGRPGAAYNRNGPRSR